MVESPSAAKLPPYLDPVDLQDDLLEWSRRIIARLIERRPPGARPTDDGRSALGVRIKEAKTLLSVPPDSSALGKADKAVDAQWARIQDRLASSASQGIDLPIERLRGFFSLSDAELKIVAALFAPQLEDDAHRLYRFAWNDFTKKQLDVGFLADLLGVTRRERDDLRRLLSSSAGLRLQRIVVLGPEEDDGREIPLLRRSVSLSGRVVDFLRGDDRVDEALIGLCEYVTPTRRLEDMELPGEVLSSLRTAVARRGSGAASGAPVLLSGPRGAGKRSLAEALAAEMGRAFLVVDLGSVFEDPRPTHELLALTMREASLMGGILHLSGDSTLPEDLSRPQALRIAQALRATRSPVFLGLTVVPRWLEDALPGMARVRIPIPEEKARERLWRKALKGGGRHSSSVDITDLSERYSLTGGAIKNAAAHAIEGARRRSARSPSLTQDDLESAARGQVMHKLGSLATRVRLSLDWNDLVIPDEELARLKEIVAFARNRRQVFTDWGFSTKVPYGTGLSALFSGPPGTGKTMAAGIIAKELGLELFKIDLSRIVDRYIGETEKNLGRMFDEATEAQAILLFDEADSLFSKRTAVRSSVDRYANLEVNYLLQRMEEFEGVTLLTTNFDAAFDDAFRRRIKFTVTFPFPEAAERKRLWRSMFPKSAPLAKDIEWDKLADQFQMSGGHIKNAAVRAAFLTAERAGKVIDEASLHEAARLEYREMGKLVRE